MMRIAARRHPADHLAIQPDRLVPDHIGIMRINDEGLETQTPAICTLRQRALLADKIRRFLIGNEPLQPRLQRPVNWPILTPPTAAPFFQPQRVHRPRPEGPEPERRALLHQALEDMALIFGFHPDLVAEIA